MRFAIINACNKDKEVLRDALHGKIVMNAGGCSNFWFLIKTLKLWWAMFTCQVIVLQAALIACLLFFLIEELLKWQDLNLCQFYLLYYISIKTSFHGKNFFKIDNFPCVSIYLQKKIRTHNTRTPLKFWYTNYSSICST